MAEVNDMGTVEVGAVSGLVEGILQLHGVAALGLLFLFTALEAPAFIGLVLPGELALVLGGVLAHGGRISLAAAIAAGVAGAIIGDSVGYFLGHRWRHLLLATPIGRRVKPERLRRAESFLNRGTGVTLFVGRLTAGARVLLPGLAGASRVPYRTFLLWNALAGALWATAHVLLGYLAGESWQRIHHLAGQIALYVLLGAAVAVAAAFLTHRLLRRRRTGAEPLAELDRAPVDRERSSTRR
jgi:membrane protein DedA with SNARE-associated domain